jgi:hypothetical protein
VSLTTVPLLHESAALSSLMLSRCQTAVVLHAQGQPVPCSSAAWGSLSSPVPQVLQLPFWQTLSPHSALPLLQLVGVDTTSQHGPPGHTMLTCFHSPVCLP